MAITVIKSTQLTRRSFTDEEALPVSSSAVVEARQTLRYSNRLIFAGDHNHL